MFKNMFANKENVQEIANLKGQVKDLKAQIKSIREQREEERVTYKRELDTASYDSKRALKDAKAEADDRLAAREREFKNELHDKEILIKELRAENEHVVSEYAETFDADRSAEVSAIKTEHAEAFSALIIDNANEIASLSKKITEAQVAQAKAEGMLAAVTAANDSLETQLESYRSFVETTLAHLPNVDLSKFQVIANVPASKAEINVLK